MKKSEAKKARRRSTRPRKDVSYKDRNINEKDRNGWDQAVNRCDLVYLEGLGWSNQNANLALRKHNGNVDTAIKWLKENHPLANLKEKTHLGRAGGPKGRSTSQNTNTLELEGNRVGAIAESIVEEMEQKETPQVLDSGSILGLMVGADDVGEESRNGNSACSSALVARKLFA
mmetsp:Transcript_6554/g.14292  ORF Transcript_6554/g.14292 Transcript_6554/m.14292 type:complete len:173 (+) Transcript_6554:210-728(+)